MGGFISAESLFVQRITSQITGGSDRNSAKFQFPLSEGYSSTLKQQLSFARDVSSN